MIHEILFAGAAFFHPHTTLDSIGTETINGKIFVIHKVDEKETLYAIARRYGASVDAIMQSNPGMTTTLEVGQILKVPYTAKAKTSSAASPQKGQKHIVAAKETMYSISRMYGVSVDEIKKWNNLTDNSLSIGQELVVRKPTTSTPAQAPPSTPAVPSTVQKTKPGQTHTVEVQETLYGIARKYDVAVQDLTKWNDLSGQELKVGQVLFVGPPDGKISTNPTTAQTPAPVTKPAAAEPVKTTPTEPKPTSETPRSEPVASQPKTQTATQTIRISESVKSSDEVMEAGLAELIEGTEGNRKYLALHRTAPVGTILKVKNEMNNREVFVRVMGKLQDTAPNSKLILKLSRSAYDRLGAIDPRFRVEVTYYK